MLNLTTEAKQAWLAQTRQVNARVTIGTTVYNADKIMSIEYDSGSISGETFQIGSFYQNSIKVVLVGILESLANDNKVMLEFAVKVGQAFEWVNMGTFYVTELDRDRNSNRTSFTAADASVYLGKNYAPTISFPNSLKNLVTDIANQCGVQVNFASMAHLADVNVTQPPNKYTCRQVISMVAQIHGGFARINRNDQLEVTRLMSSDIELLPSHYLLKGLTKNETTYRTDGIIVKIGENEEDVLKVGTTTGSAVINLENPLMTQTLLNEMWRVVSIISYYPFNLKWRGIPNLEAGDWITIVDKQGTRYRVPNLSYKLSFKGGLYAESSANTTATSNVQHKLRGTLTQRVEDVEGYINATGGRSYTGLDVPDNKYLKKGDTWYKPDGDDTAILVYDGEKWEEVASPEVFRKLQADFDELDRQAKEAFEQVDTLVQESPETKRLAQEAQEAVNLANQEITKLQTSVSDTKTALENAEQEFADSLATTTRELTAKISGIEIGGRNLLKDTANFGNSGMPSGAKDGWLNSSSATLESEKYNGLTVRSLKNVTSEKTMCNYYFTGFNLGDTYTLSFWAKGTIDKFVCYFYGDSGYVKAKVINASIPYYSSSGYEDGYCSFVNPKITNWTRISVTWELDSVGDINIAKRVLIRTDEATGGDFYVCGVKLEKGNKATDWSPAPEDFESDLSNTSIELSTKITESAASLRTEMSEKYSTKNDLTTLSGEYNSFKEETAKKFSQQVSSIQTIQTDTTEAQKLANDAYSKAQSAVASATNASSTANSAVSTANTAKSNADKAIADVASLNQTVSSQSTRIDQTSSRIDQVASGVTEVGNRLDSLSVGGRNLLHGTVDFVDVGSNYNSGRLIETAFSLTGEKYKGLAVRGKTNISGTYTASSYSFSNFNLAETYTFSFYAKGSIDKFRCYFYGDTGYVTASAIDTNIGWMPGIYNDGMVMYRKGSGSSKELLDSNIFKRYYVTWKLNNTGDTSVVKKILIRTDEATSGDLYICGEKMEIGNKNTDYSPSPEDNQSQIDGINNNIANNYYAKTTVDSKLSTAVSGITAQYTKDITTRLGNYYDKATIDSKLTIDGQGIASYVKNTQSQLNNLSIGSENLIINGGNITDISPWQPRYKDKFGIYKHPFYYNGEKNIFRLDTTSTTDENYVNSNRFEVKRNTDYTLSFIGFYNSNVRSAEILFLGRKSTETNVQYSYVKSMPLVLSNGSAVYKTITFNSGDNDTGYIRIDNNGTLSEGNLSTLYFGEVMLVEGNVAKKYQPSSAEFPTLTQYTEVKQLADRISSTVYDSASGLVSKTTQLAGKYAIQNLNSYGDVLASLNLNGGNVRIKGGLIDLDGNVRIQDAFVTNLKANSILANEITAKATTVVNAKIANLDAGVITTGILKGTNLSLNLGTGEVQFQKGRIQAPNNTLDIQVNTGIMKVLNTNGEGMTLQNGNLYFSGAWNKEYGSIEYSGLLDNGRDGILVSGYNGCVMGTKSQRDTWLSGVYKPIADGGSFWVNEFENKGYAGILAKTNISLTVNALVKSSIDFYTGMEITNSNGTGEITTNSHNTSMNAQERFEIKAKDIYLNGNVRSNSGLVTADANYKLTFVFVPGGQSYFIVDTGIVSGKYRFNVTQI